jgi:hypothetical protein
MKRGTLMRTKIYALGLACILLICCDSKVLSPSVPNPNVKPNPNLDPPTIVYFTANPSTIKLGEKSTLSWEVHDCTSVEIDNGIGLVSSKGSIKISPLATTTYTLEAKNYDLDATKSDATAYMAGATKTCTVNVEN